VAGFLLLDDGSAPRDAVPFDLEQVAELLE